MKTTLTYEQKKTLSETRHVVDQSSFFDDIVPPDVTEVVQAFASELSPLPPVRVPLRIDDKAVYGWPADGVREKIRADGGSIGFGWRLRAWPEVLLTAEPHAVWVDPDGSLIDITPDVAAGDTSLFVPASNDFDLFDTDRSPPTRYRVLHAPPDWSAAIAERIARMKSGQRAYEDRRAQKAGKTLEEWTREKYFSDPLPGQIATFIAACEAFDATLPRLPMLITDDPDSDEAELPDHASDELTPVISEPSSATANDDAFGAGEQTLSGEPPPEGDSQSGSRAVAETDIPFAPDESDDDEVFDDDEDVFDVTWLAADILDRRSRERDIAREAIIRTLSGP